VACSISLKSFQQRLQLCFRPHLNWRSARKVMGPQSHGNPNFGNFDSHMRVPKQNAMWMWASWRGTKYIIKGKVVASPKFGPWWVLWVRVCLWFLLAPKVFQLCLNHLVFGFVQVHVSSWCLSLFLVPSRNSSMPLYPPQNATSQGACPIPCIFVVFTSDLYLSLSRNLGAHHMCRY